MAAASFGRKTWRLRDIIRSDGAEEVVSVLKITHPFRHQRFTIVPTPRYATEQFYNEWVYQPYAKEHIMYVSNDIYNPLYVFLCRSLLTSGLYPGYAYFHPMGFPDCVQLNITRRKFVNRERPLKTPALRILLTPTSWRDRHHPWVAKRVLDIAGDLYVTHPSEENASNVLVLPPEYVAEAVNALTSLGFQLEDHADVPIGKTEDLQRLTQRSNMAQMLTLTYLWGMIVLFVVGECIRWRGMFEDYKREMVIKAGKDPKEMGL